MNKWVYFKLKWLIEDDVSWAFAGLSSFPKAEAPIFSACPRLPVRCGREMRCHSTVAHTGLIV